MSATSEVKYKIGNERLVKVTGSAAAKLSQLLQRQGRPQGALRVAVIGGGCSGLQYKMDLVDGPANRDILVESNSVRVVVDPKERSVCQRFIARLQRRPPERRIQGDKSKRRRALLVRRKLLCMIDYFALLDIERRPAVNEEFLKNVYFRKTESFRQHQVESDDFASLNYGLPNPRESGNANSTPFKA